MKFEFDMNMFWKMGIACFLIIALANIYSTVHFWQVLDLGAKVSKIAGIFFNFLLAYFFYWMFTTNKKTEVQEMKSDEEILKLFKENGKKIFNK